MCLGEDAGGKRGSAYADAAVLVPVDPDDELSDDVLGVELEPEPLDDPLSVAPEPDELTALSDVPSLPGAPVPPDAADFEESELAVELVEEV